MTGPAVQARMGAAFDALWRLPEAPAPLLADSAEAIVVGLLAARPPMPVRLREVAGQVRAGVVSRGFVSSGDARWLRAQAAQYLDVGPTPPGVPSDDNLGF